MTGLTNGNTYSCSVVATKLGSSAPSAGVTAIPAALTATRGATITRTDWAMVKSTYMSRYGRRGSAVTGYTATCTDGTTLYGHQHRLPYQDQWADQRDGAIPVLTKPKPLASVLPPGHSEHHPEQGATGLPLWLCIPATQ
ncbi:MAG: hypothetical protein CM15mP74_17050 [Halieaceae bacterium]|nr:MAG: hypothetical protein CM15mP74_17050 [Halieaceae bacterium]